MSSAICGHELKKIDYWLFYIYDLHHTQCNETYKSNNLLFLCKCVCKIEVVLAVIFIFLVKQFLHFWATRLVSCATSATSSRRTNTISMFLGNIVVARATNLCRLNSVSVFLGDKICGTSDNPCHPKTLFFCFVLGGNMLLSHIQTFCVFE